MKRYRREGWEWRGRQWREGRRGSGLGPEKRGLRSMRRKR
jgi:hypothetical protein